MQAVDDDEFEVVEGLLREVVYNLAQRRPVWPFTIALVTTDGAE